MTYFHYLRKLKFMCDIEGMFHQVKVKEEYRDLLQFLWWEVGDLTKEPKKKQNDRTLVWSHVIPRLRKLCLKVYGQ